MQASLIHSKTHTISPIITWLKIGLLIAVFTYIYISAFSLLLHAWINVPSYSHGFLVPFISLYFVWVMRERLRELSIQPNISIGLLLILTGCFMLIAGKVGSVAILQELSILIIIPGLVLMLLGTKYLRALALPLAYLILMVPVFDIVINRIQWPFQLLSASMSVKFLELLGIPAVLDSQYIILPKITFEVAKACSGIQFLISIIAIAIPLAYFGLREWWLRGMLFVFAIIIAITTNWLRIIIVALWSIGGGKVLHGPYHILQGLFVSVVGIIFLIITAWILGKFSSQNTPSGYGNSNIKKGIIDNDSILGMKRFNKALLAAIVVLFCVGCYMHLYKPRPIPLETPLNELPLMIGDWKGEVIDQDYSKPFVVQGVDSEIIRLYRSPSGREVKLYVGYFESQSQDKELIHYSLQALYENSEEINVPMGTNGLIKANKAVLKAGSQKFLLLYLYDLNGRIVSNRYKAKLITILQGLLHARTNGSIAIFYRIMNHSDEYNEVFEDEAHFIREAIPVLKDYLPKL